MSPENDLPSQLPLFNGDADQRPFARERPALPTRPISSTASDHRGSDNLDDGFDVALRNEEQETIYEELVQLSEERASTLWIDPLYEDAYETLIALTAAEAARIGLAETVILEAMRLGKERGQALNQPAPVENHQRYEDDPEG